MNNENIAHAFLYSHLCPTGCDGCKNLQSINVRLKHKEHNTKNV